MTLRMFCNSKIDSFRASYSCKTKKAVVYNSLAHSSQKAIPNKLLGLTIKLFKRKIIWFYPPQQIFPSLRSMETQHSFRVPRVCTPKKHREQQCVRNNVNLVPRVLSLPRESTLVTAGHVSMQANQSRTEGGSST